MREKIRLSDLSVLYVCLSDGWGANERRCLSDASYFRNLGGTSFILCRQRSLLDLEAQNEDIPRIYFSGDLSSWRGKLNFYFQLQPILQKHTPEIVHTYTHDSLLPLGMNLKALPQTPLIYTFNENITLKGSFILDQWMISRVDSIFTFSPNISELAAEIYPVSPRKIHVTGAGIDFPTKITKSAHADEKKKIVAFISRSEDEIEQIRLLSDAIPPLLASVKGTRWEGRLCFLLLTDVPWHEHPLYDQLKRMILERGLEMDFRFETRPLSTSSFQDCDLFIGLPAMELFSDLDLYALVTQTPLLLPRTSTRQQLVKQGRFGETYQPEDSRELREKISKILNNYSHYLEELNGVESELQEQHHFERYAEELYAHYEKLYTQRARLIKKKKRQA